MKTVYQTLDNGKKIPYLVTDDFIDGSDPTIGIPVQFKDVNFVDWNTVLITLHNAYMIEGFYTKDDIVKPARRKRFIELTRSILLSEILKFYIGR